MTRGGWRDGFPHRGRGSADYIKAGGGLYKGWLTVWWSFGSGLLTDWCLITWTLRQCFDYSDCDSVADSYTFVDCNVLTWQSAVLVIMTGLGQGSAIGAYREQAQQMRRSHDASGFLQMNMDSLGVMDLDLSISPDVFGLRAFDEDSPIARMLPGSTPCELWLMLPDAKLGIDGFHDIIIENLTASPTWMSSHISPADITVLRRRWPKNVFTTLSRRAPDVERLRRDARKRSDRAFRHSGPGYCIVCDERVYPALGAHMIAFHLELAQLWRCPVEWCAVWKGSVRGCLEHLTEKHGGSTFFAMKNVAKLFPPWTVTRSVWLHALRTDVSGIAVDALLFNEAGRRLVHRYRIYRDPFPHPALRDGVVLRLLSCVCRAMAIAQRTHLRISIPSSGAPPGQVPGECFPGGAPHVRPPSRRHVSFADKVTMLGDAELSVCSPEAELPPLILPVVVEDSSVAPVEELIELVPSALGSSLPPPPGFTPFAWPVNDGGIDVDKLCSSVGVDCSPISRVCTDVSDVAVSPGVGVLVSPIIDGSSDAAPAVGHAELTLPPVDNSCVQDMLWAPAAPQDTRPNDDWEIPVPRWRLAREGPFLAERSPESIRSICACLYVVDIVYVFVYG